MSPSPGPETLTAAQATRALSAGDLTSEALVAACLTRIDARDQVVRAWLDVDREGALAAARESDRRRVGGDVRSSLDGVPFGVKDVIDVAGRKCTRNSPLYKERIALDDAACVGMLRAAGAIPLGMTDTVEFAAKGRLAATRNPHNLAHTPGGSSSGSGAAVADFQVPLALGTQTGGSVIRPAAYCGVYAMKPTWGMVSTCGVTQFAPSLDTIGWYGRCVEDLALVAGTLGLSANGAPGHLRIALCHGPARYADQCHALLERISASLDGCIIETRELPDSFDKIVEVKNIIMNGEGRVSFLPYLEMHGDDLHDGLRALAENRSGISADALKEAYDYAALRRIEFEAHYDNFDAILTISATDEAEGGLTKTGNSAPQSLWTLLHAPTIAIPAGKGEAGLPLGVQLVGFRGRDAELLAVAEALAPQIDPWHGRVRIPG